MDRIVRTALQGGEGPDIVMTPGPAYANEYIDANLFAELDEYSEQYKWDDKLLSWAPELGRYEVQLAEVGCGDRPQPSGAAALSIDGTSELQVLLRVVLPLSWPGFLTIALVSGIAAWNEFLFAVTFIQDNNLKPIITSFWAFRSNFSTDWGLTSAAGIIVTCPSLYCSSSCSRFISGLTAGGLKG
jgi:Binding-protein-dependent transport system inner membrane component